MKYLLDVNALMAWGHPSVAGHDRFHLWAKREGFGSLATCAHVELGFLRVSMAAYGFSLDSAQIVLAGMKRHVGGFVGSAPAPQLARWARTPGRTSDAYLIQLAESAGLRLATFDTSIPDAVRI